MFASLLLHYYYLPSIYNHKPATAHRSEGMLQEQSNMEQTDIKVIFSCDIYTVRWPWFIGSTKWMQKKCQYLDLYDTDMSLDVTFL